MRVYRIVYHDDDVTQKWVLVCLDVSFNRKAFQFKERGVFLQEGVSPPKYQQKTIVKGFLLKHGLIVLQMETDYTLTVFSMQKHKLVMSHKFSNHSTLVRDRLQLDPSMAVSIYCTSKGNKVVLCMVYTGPKGQKATVNESKHQPWLIRVVPLCFK